MRLSDFVRRLFFKVTHISKFPKGNLTGCFLNLKQRGFKPQLAIDVGANKTKWSRELLSIFPACECLLIEPQIEMKRYLDRFCKRHPGCQWICAGAGAAVGELPFTLIPDTVSSSFAMSREDASAAGFPQRVVPLITLDQVVQEHCGGQIPDIVKIDAEGFESEILRGAQRLLGQTEIIFLETHFFGNHIEKCGIIPLTATMSNHGYVPYDFTWFGRRPYDGAIGLCEVAYVRKEGILRSFQGWQKHAG